ncbi:hypothetical protein PR202_ga28589 [Eleusine coracana subsp. coracana]|uniref:Rx N-terminal domain-containing protein n=1 Tax=Eleusine coracana subsp. coracana TaxID=191504 RepID=A0AAV5DK02_ELECO|nr:hypothetical protein PR202_ga28589 [Eleusine coracana subsp. coracana]
MEAFFNAVLTDIVSRSVSFFMDKYYKFTTTPSAEGNRVNDLQQLLLRIRVIVEEAEGRLITNQAMVHQLNILRKEMYRGYFTIDSLRCHCTGTTNNHDVSYSFALSKFNPAKRLFLPGDGDACGMKDIQQVLDNLNRIMIHMSEFVTFLSICPPLCRQPYHMHLFIDKCMFGRQMEMDRIMGFLMQREHPSTNCVDVLPIVGPTCVGKSTLVAHVCNDARVRSYFSQIVVLNGDDIGDENIATLKERAVFMHQSHKTVSKDQRLLVIIEFPTDVDEVAWNSLYSSFSRCLVRGSKIIITGRSNKIRKFGTTRSCIKLSTARRILVFL